MSSAIQTSGGGSCADRDLDAISAASSSDEDEDEGVSSEATSPRHDGDRLKPEGNAMGDKAKLYEVPREERLQQRDCSTVGRPRGGTTETKTPPTRDSIDRTLETQFHGFSPDEEVDDDGEGNYQVVKKSIYKTSRKGFLHRLAGASGAASAKHSKYVISDITSIVTGEDGNDTSQPPTPRKAKEAQDAEILINEEEGIQVAIDNSAATLDGALAVHQTRRLNAEDAAMGGPSEVVIHSGESDASFATLNPVIKSSLQRGGSTFVASAPAAPAMTASSAISIAKGTPILMEIPTLGEATNYRDRLLLIINALGASGLPKAERFGTQSCLLEMRLCEVAETHAVSEISVCSSYMMRTELHKKGGSEAQWNQQFTTSLRSKKDQFLHVAVKTSSKIIVGEANVLLDKVGDLFYDQHYPLSRPDSSNEMHSDDPVILAGGQLHLQLKIVDAALVSLVSAVVPPLRLPPSVSSIAELSNKRIPPVLRNGNLFFKIPYHTHNLVGYAAGPTRQWVTVVRAVEPPHLQLTWGDPTVSGSAEKRGAHSLDLALVTEVREGHGTKAFRTQTDSSVVKEKEKCFSLITKTRTLDLVAASKEEAHIWVSSLRDLLFAPATSAEGWLDSARTIEGFKQSALTPRDPSITSDDKPVAAVPSKRMVAAWRSRIFNLARNGRLDEIVECWQDGCPIDLLESGSGDTLLILACRQGNDQLVELCLSRRAKNDPHPEFGETALQVAVNACQPHCVKLLLSTAAKSEMDSEIVNHIDPNNDAPLHVAASHGDLACLQLLLHHGADICVVEEFGRTPLHCAVANGNHDCVAYLLDVGGDSVLNSGDHDGDTALHYAALSGNEATAKLLLESAANVFATNIHSETPYDIAVREKQQKCAELIAKYFLTNEKDTSCSPVTRNETASTLLRRQRQEHAAFGCQDDEDEAEEKTIEDPRASCSFVNSEGWQTSPHHKWANQDHEGGFAPYQALELPPSNYVASGVATSRMPLSPSEQVRDALTRNHRANSFSSAQRRPSWHDISHHSARESSSYLGHPTYNERLIATERSDREHMPQFQRYSMEDKDVRYPQGQHWDYYSRDRDYPSYGTRNRSQTAPEYTQAPCAYWTENTPYNDRHMQDMAVVSITSSRVEAATPMAWSQHSPTMFDPRTRQTPPPDVEQPQWDTMYNEDGYPYYVNRRTGVSQWVKPNSEERGIDSYTALHPQVDTTAEILAPDAIIRLRLTEARKQKALTTLVSPASSSTTTTCSTPGRNYQRPTDSSLNEMSIPHSSTPSKSIPATEPPQIAVVPLEVPPPLDDGNRSLISHQPSPESPEPSKYEARTGLKLSVNVSAPPAQDGSRPALVPSPRSKSPIKKFQQAEGGGEDSTSGSFQKSRASSPRGRSKNIQLIELKRANNLALALASFKIHDHYEQIVSDIVAMDERVVNAALLGCLQRFFPTEKEKQALQNFDGSVSTLGKAERFFCLLFRVPGMQERIDMFLYKMEFTRTHSSLLSRILVVKRACRDLAENFHFIQALEEFFKKQHQISFSVFQENKSVFIARYLSEADEKLKSFRVDLQNAVGVELMELQMQLNRLVSGIRPIRSFVERSPSSSLTRAEDHDCKARDILQRFLLETRAPLAEIESEYEAMELWGDKLLAVFGESKASCHVAAILQGVIELLQ